MSIWSSRATMQTARRREEQGPRCSSGDATPQVRKHAFKCGAVARSRVAPTRIYAQALLRRPRALAATRVGRGGEQRPMPLLSALGQVDEAQAASACSGAHLFVGSPRNIDILLRALLLRPATHIASVAHVPIYETGSGHERYRSVIAALHSKHQP